MAGRDRGCGGRIEQVRCECAAQDPGRAATESAAAAGEPSAARVLPTMRSRCRVLGLRPLATGDVARAAAAAIGREPDEPSVIAAAAAPKAVCDGLSSFSMRTLSTCASASCRCSMRLPGIDPRALHAIGDRLCWHRSGSTLDAFVDAVNAGSQRAWLPGRIPPSSIELPPYGRNSTSARDVDNSILSANHWCSTSLDGLPRHRAVASYGRITACS